MMLVRRRRSTACFRAEALPTLLHAFRGTRSPVGPGPTKTIRLALVLALLAGCAAAPEPLDDADITLAAALAPFDDCDALTGRIREHALEQIATLGMVHAAAGFEAAQGRMAETADAVVPLSAPQAEAGGAAGAAFSATNVQEAGVDEADLAKTDGAWLYTVPDGTTVRVVDVRRDQPDQAATIRLGEGNTARELLLLGDRLLVVGDSFPTPPIPMDPAGNAGATGSGAAPAVADDTATADAFVDVERILPAPSRTKLWLVDVADPTQPEILSTMAIDGWTVATRLTGQTARVVLRAGLVPPPMAVPEDGSARAQGRAAEINRERIRDSVAQDWLPRVQVDGAGEQTLVDCQQVYEPRGFRDLGLVSVLSLDMTGSELDADRAEAVLGGADTVYANDEHLYVTTSRWPVPDVVLPVEPMPMPAPVPDTRVAPADPPADGDPSARPFEPSPAPEGVPAEPPAGEDVPAEAPPPEETESITTEVHRFDLVGDGARYAVSGSVSGQLLNQWAMSEHEGDLRIATTEGALSPDRRTHSSVRILRERDGRLRTIGRVADLGRGEQIYAVRYAGDIGFVVTFRQVDPLYTLDLSAPTDPRMLGELKVPGYSAYLHPVDDDLLLGVGQNADQQGRATGVQVSLFDIADLAQPRRVAHLALGRNTFTDVEHDHRAFLYWPDEQMAVLPVADWQHGGKVGAAVLRVAPREGLVERGFIEHPVHHGAAPPVQRAFVIDDRIVTVTYAGVLASDLVTLEPLGEAAFAP